MDLGDSLSAPWKRLAPSLAQRGIEMFNWTPGCRFPPKTSAEKGIESAHTHELRALLAQASDKVLPLSVQRVDAARREGNFFFHQQVYKLIQIPTEMLNCIRPVVSTIAFGKPLMRRYLWADNTVTEELVHAGKSKQVALQAAEPSSELTSIDDSSDSAQGSPSPSPTKPPPAPPVRQRQSKKIVTEPSKRKLVHVVEEESETESRPKRQKPQSSDTSIEVGDVQPAPKTRAAKAKPVAKSRTTRSTTKKKTQAKSKEYVEDSDDNMEGNEGPPQGKEEHTEVIGEWFILSYLSVVLSQF